MAIKVLGLRNQMRAIITNKSKAIFKSYKETYVRMLDKLGKSWQKEVRALLSVRHTGRGKNTTAWPMRRTGGLQRSIKSPHVSRTTERARGFYYEADISFTPLFKKYAGNKKVWKGTKDPTMPTKVSVKGDVGELLNDWDGKPFAGWKVRASILFGMAIQRASYLRRKNNSSRWETKDFFVRSMINDVERRTYQRG